jgi:hypothetical protein
VFVELGNLLRTMVHIFEGRALAAVNIDFVSRYGEASDLVAAARKRASGGELAKEGEDAERLCTCSLTKALLKSCKFERGQLAAAANGIRRRAAHHVLSPTLERQVEEYVGSPRQELDPELAQKLEEPARAKQVSAGDSWYEGL